MIKKYVDYLHKRQLIKYIFAGGTAFGLEYVSFLTLFYALNVPILQSNTISFLIGFLTSFLFNSRWTFKVKNQYKWASHHQLAAYLLLSLFNLAASNFMVYELHKFVPATIGKLVAGGVIACWNFVIFRAVIFKVVIAPPSS